MRVLGAVGLKSLPSGAGEGIGVACNVSHVTGFECVRSAHEIRWYRVLPRPDRARERFSFSPLQNCIN